MQLQASMKSKSAEESNGGNLKKVSSTPDLKSSVQVPLIPLEELKNAVKSKTDLDLNQRHLMHYDDGKVGDQRGYFTLPGRRKLPPPETPPPPPPPPQEGVLVTVKSPEKTASSPNKSPVMSSFKPDEQPDSLPPQEVKRSPPVRANSMPPRASRPQVLKKIDTNKETYSINGVTYTTHTTFR